MNSTEDAVRDWMHSATPAPTGRVDVGAVMARARSRRRARAIAIPSLAAVVVAAAITVVIVAAGPDRSGSGIAAPPSTSRIADAASCSKAPADPDSRVLRVGTAQQMVPPGTISADVCHYGKSTDGVSNGRLLDSDHLDFVTAATLARQLNRTDVSKPFANQLRGPCFVGGLQATTVTFTYSVGPPVTVAFFLNGCLMTNGALHQAVNPDLNTWIYAYPPAQDVTAGPAVSP